MSTSTDSNDQTLREHDTNRPSCALCCSPINDPYGGNNGLPLVSGKVCDTCNVMVVMHRLMQAQATSISRETPEENGDQDSAQSS